MPFDAMSEDEVAKVVKEHDERIIDNWNTAVPSKKHTVYHLGDIAMNVDHGMAAIAKCNGIKHLILGNREHSHLDRYLPHFNRIQSTARLKSLLTLSHVPLHPNFLEERQGFGVFNVHGHIHSDPPWPSSPEGPYFNVNCQYHDYTPVPLELVLEKARAWIKSQEDT